MTLVYAAWLIAWEIWCRSVWWITARIEPAIVAGLRLLPPETAHHTSMWLLRLYPTSKLFDSQGESLAKPRQEIRDEG